MKKETLEDNKTVLQEIAHFLAINSEAIGSNGLSGKMPLLYFFFTYSQKLEKQNYTDFAFEILEETLAEELREMQTSESQELPFNLATLQMGWSLQQFSTSGFFESDELNEILVPFDKMGLGEAELLVKSNPSAENIGRYVFIYSYLNERLWYWKNDDTKSLIFKENASNLIKGLHKCFATFSIKNKHLKIILEHLFDTHRNLDTERVIDIHALIEVSDTAKKENDLETMLLLKCCFPEISKTWDKTVHHVKFEVVSKVNNYMRISYENHDTSDHSIVPKIANYGIFLLMESTNSKVVFLAHSIGAIYPEKQNM